jgi:hypothetical protein
MAFPPEAGFVYAPFNSDYTMTAKIATNRVMEYLLQGH